MTDIVSEKKVNCPNDFYMVFFENIVTPDIGTVKVPVTELYPEPSLRSTLSNINLWPIAILYWL